MAPGIEDDASQFLAEVQRRLTRAGEKHKYREFLKAVTGGTVDTAEALDILVDHQDLVAVFQKHFQAQGGTRPLAPPKKRVPLPGQQLSAAPRNMDGGRLVLIKDEAVGGAKGAGEMSTAAEFLAEVKKRLKGQGQEERYQEFVVAMSGGVDLKAAVRILRGHEDLITEFKRHFAPRTDLSGIKAELAEEDDQPRPPSRPPSAPNTAISRSVVKMESGLRVKDEGDGTMPHPPSLPPGAKRGSVTVGDDSDVEEMTDVTVLSAVRKGKAACIAELAKIVFAKERGSGQAARERVTLVRYATRRAAQPRFPRELILLRGPPGTGKSDYAVQRLTEQVDIQRGEEVAARLTHVCSAADFCEKHTEDGVSYKFDPRKLEAHLSKNEMRVMLAMEAGIHPLFIDNPHVKLWEMQPYVALAERLGYVVSVVEPWEVCDVWEDLDYLTSRCDATGRPVSVEKLEMMISSHEQFPGDSGEDPAMALRDLKRPPGPRLQVGGGATKEELMGVKAEAATGGAGVKRKPPLPSTAPPQKVAKAGPSGRPAHISAAPWQQKQGPSKGSRRSV